MLPASWAMHEGAISGTALFVVTSSWPLRLKTHSAGGKNHACYWKPSQLSEGKEDMNLRKESTPTILLDQQSSLFQYSTPIFIPTDKCSHHLSSKKPLFLANGDNHRKPQLDTMQRAADCSSSTDTCVSQLLHPWGREGHRRGAGTISRARIRGNLLWSSLS